MAKGVSGALTRLAKIKVFSPPAAAPGANRPGTAAGRREEDEAFFMPDDPDDFPRRSYAKRHADVIQERPAAPLPPPPAAVPAAAAPVPPARPATPVGRQRVGLDDYEPYEDVVDDGIPVGRGGGRIAERIRRLRTSLAARTGRESEPEEAVRGRARAPLRSLTLVGEEEEHDLDRNFRSSCRPKQVARVRRRLGMTQAEFARCFGLATEDVVRWEAGAKPSRAERVLLTLIMHDPEEMARLVDEALTLV